jgi:PAS domain S-box-containing protein
MAEATKNNSSNNAGGEARYRAIFENAAVGIARVTPNGRFEEVNQRLCDILGYAPEELLAKTFGDITYPDDLKADLTAMERILAGESTTYLREKRYFRKDGSVVWANLAVFMIRKPEGSPDYFVSVVEDISTRKWAEQKLHEEEQRLRLASRVAGLGIFEWDVQADCAVWENERMYEIFGHTLVDGTLSKTQLLQQYVHPDDVDTLNSVLSDGAKSGRPIHTVYRIYRKDGALRWLDLAGNFESGPDGSPKKMIGVLADITEQRLADEALHASHAQFRLLADTAPVMIWTSEKDKLCNFFNKSWLDFTGRSMEEELGNGWTEGIFPEDCERCLNVYATYFEAQKPFKIEYRLRRFDGEYRWLLDHAVPRFSPGGKFLGYIGSCIDITDLKQAEAEREELAHEQAARAAAEAAIQAKDEFLTMVSHELRSPLNAILGYAQLLRPGRVTIENINKAVGVIERNAKAQLQIIEDLLDSARIMTGKLRIAPVPVDLAPVLDAALDTVRATAEAKGITLVTDFGGGTEQLLGDSTRLQQIVSNLLSNAVKFTSDGGRVELHMESDEDWVRLTVRDTGKGIEPEFLPHVFERFRQADSSSGRRHAGVGLGLSIVKYLVELHGGAITAASEGAGCGSTFTVKLPRRHPELLLSAG